MDNGKVLLGILAGVAAGATLGILFAPDSGVNTRKKILRKGEDYANGLNGRFNKLVNTLNEEVEDFKEELDQMVDSGIAKMEEEEGKVVKVKNNVVSALS